MLPCSSTLHRPGFCSGLGYQAVDRAYRIGQTKEAFLGNQGGLGISVHADEHITWWLRGWHPLFVKMSSDSSESECLSSISLPIFLNIQCPSWWTVFPRMREDLILILQAHPTTCCADFGGKDIYKQQVGQQLFFISIVVSLPCGHRCRQLESHTKRARPPCLKTAL